MSVVGLPWYRSNGPYNRSRRITSAFVYSDERDILTRISLFFMRVHEYDNVCYFIDAFDSMI